MGMSSELVGITSESSELIKTDSTEPNFVKYRHLITAWVLSYTSENTQQAYLHDLKIFCTFLDEAGLDLLQVRRTHLDIFSRVHEQYTDAPASVARRLAAISALYRFLLLGEVIEKSPAPPPSTPTSPQPPPSPNAKHSACWMPPLNTPYVPKRSWIYY